jgi:CxxC-x17-CxxC domain-containing protein
MAKTLTKYLKRGGHPLSFEDKVLQCSDCGQDFTFTAGEQEFYASRGFQNEPKRCPDCRRARKAQRYGDGGYGGGYRAPRKMFPVVCAQCGVETEVPFEPREDRPVYCSDCYNKIKAEN